MRVIMSAGAFLHHDFDCHQNSRTHCPSCQLTQHAQKTEAGGAPLDAPRGLVGQIEWRSDFSAERRRFFHLRIAHLLRASSPN